MAMHLFGGAAALQVFTVLSVHHGIAPPTANLSQPDVPLPREALVGPAALPLPSAPRAALCSSFGFGGTNACLLLATHVPQAAHSGAA
jgi:3-oxoacyl-[acyl-carrier-protein] synthase II